MFLSSSIDTELFIVVRKTRHVLIFNGILRERERERERGRERESEREREWERGRGERERERERYKRESW